MKQLGHTQFRPAIVHTREAVEVTSHGEVLGIWIPRGTAEWDIFQAANPTAVTATQVVRLEPFTPSSSPHDEARNRAQQQRQRDEVLRKVSTRPASSR